MNIKKNLCDLIKEAYFYQYAGIADTAKSRKRKKPKLYFTKIQFGFIIVSILINFILPNGFSKDFAGYVISGMSLFVGLFFTFILKIFDDFSNINFEPYHKSVNEEKYLIGVRLKNYFKRTTVLSLYTILLSIVCIILLSITLLFESKVATNINLCSFIMSINDYSCCSVLKILGLLIYRSFVIYFLLDFILITVFLISSFYDFMISEYDKVKLS